MVKFPSSWTHRHITFVFHTDACMGHAEQQRGHCQKWKRFLLAWIARYALLSKSHSLGSLTPTCAQKLTSSRRSCNREKRYTCLHMLNVRQQIYICPAKLYIMYKSKSVVALDRDKIVVVCSSSAKVYTIENQAECQGRTSNCTAV